MIRKICLVTIIFALCISCITYTRRLVTPKGARLKTDCGYEESNNFYDIIGIYVKNAKIKPFLYKNGFTVFGRKTKYEEMVFKLVKGKSIILLLWGRYDPHPGTTAHAHEELGLFIGLDSIITGDSLFFKKNGIPTIFYFDRFYDMLQQTGYTRDLDGYLFIDSIHGDTISGIIDFSAETKGYYSSFHAGQSIYDTTGSWVGCDIKFKATLEQSREDSVSIGSVILRWSHED